MKISKLFLSVVIIDLVFSINKIVKTLEIEDILTKSICKIANYATNSKTDTQNIFIGNLGGKAMSKTTEDISRCVGHENPVVVFADFRVKIMERKLWKASVMILIFEKINVNIVKALIDSQLNSAIFHHEAKVLCVLPASLTFEQRIKSLEAFAIFGFLKVAFVHQTTFGTVNYEIVNSLDYRGKVLINPEDSTAVFPNKLKNLQGYQYRVAIYYQPPLITGKGISSPLQYFLKAIAHKQNAKIKIMFMPNAAQMLTVWNRRQMDLTINTAIAFKLRVPKLFTYDKKNFCALVPIPPKASLFQLIFIKPFDGLTWMFFGISIICSVAVWRLYRSHGAVDSHWQIAVGIFTIFIGQGAAFSRRNRFVLAVLLNIICLSVFILSNLYEGAITSFMIEPIHENRLKSLADLVASKYEIIADNSFEFLIKNSSLLEELKPRLNSSGAAMGDEGDKHVIEQRYVFIRTCDVAKISLATQLQNGKFVSNYYYLLAEELTWQFIELEASYLNPFVTRLQYYMDLSFQAGLPHMWKVFVSHGYSDVMSRQTRENKDYLELADLVPVFGVLLIGCGLSAIVLLAEIFYRDCLGSWDVGHTCSTCWNCVKRCCTGRNKISKPKVRKVIVQPKNESY